MVTTQSERTFGVSCIIKFFLRNYQRKEMREL